MEQTEAQKRAERIRARAHRSWEREGKPEGKAAEHWERAEEEIAIEENQRFATKPNPLTRPDQIGPYGEPVEPIEAVENQGEFPDVRDQGDTSIPARRGKSSAA
jgi:hypothetical protein